MTHDLTLSEQFTLKSMELQLANASKEQLIQLLLEQSRILMIKDKYLRELFAQVHLSEFVSPPSGH